MQPAAVLPDQWPNVPDALYMWCGWCVSKYRAVRKGIS